MLHHACVVHTLNTLYSVLYRTMSSSCLHAGSLFHDPVYYTKSTTNDHDLCPNQEGIKKSMHSAASPKWLSVLYQGPCAQTWWS